MVQTKKTIIMWEASFDDDTHDAKYWVVGVTIAFLIGSYEDLLARQSTHERSEFKLSALNSILKLLCNCRLSLMLKSIVQEWDMFELRMEIKLD